MTAPPRSRFLTICFTLHAILSVACGAVYSFHAALQTVCDLQIDVDAFHECSLLYPGF